MTEPVAPPESIAVPPAFVSVENASLYYGADSDVLALQDTSFSIARGEFVAVVGPSGCGKSTLLKLISGLSLPTAGRVIVDGQEVRKPLKNIGMAFQNPALLPWRTTIDNLLLPLQVVRPHRHEFGRKRRQYVDHARALLAKVGLEGVDDRFPWQLSGGMQQRVSLCRSLIHDPQILLLDEPFGALDAFTREELWDTLQALWEEQKFTVLLVTHDLTEAVYLADKVLVMSRRPGRVTYSAKIDLPRPRNEDTRFTPAFVEHVRDLRRHIGHARSTP
ncbi:MAG: NitT/TauT family transport system ATP-binding protein [Xanthobacteraceae bacterium]|jgi:NitT/TauT family transport system ATP-binding protein|nr:NitT/TauT family transport system ATP-binding protein [Xanthobacteraceae bacterium]